MSDFPADTPTCTFHPKVPTLLSCTRCERPACPDCLVQAAVGRHCVDCVKGQSKLHSGVARELTARQRAQRRPGWLFWSITGVFILMCVVVAQMRLVVVPGDGVTFLDFDTGLKVASFVMVLVGWIVSLCLHEWAHAFVAFKSGDHSVLGRGYLTLDPRKYTDPITSIALPLLFVLMGGFGLPGGAVWINRGALRSRGRASMVSLAGPAVNLAVAAACMIPLSAGLVGPDRPVLEVGLAFLGFLQVAAFVLNILPFPGLDGFGALEPYLPAPLLKALAPIRRWGLLILIGVLFYFQPANDLFWSTILSVIDAFDVNQDLVRQGFRLFRFWDRWLTDEEYPHIFVLDLATAKATDLLPGSKRYFGLQDGSGAYDVSPEGTTLVFAANSTGEPYRTLLGHMRHESGHYYWDRLIPNSAELEGFRGLFGDERPDYAQALARHYQQGAQPDWQSRFVSSYASAHPWEDWAETWAHYLHVFDTLETAAACGVSLRPTRTDEPTLPRLPRADTLPATAFDNLMDRWFPLTYVLNNLNRGLGLADSYPFVLSASAIEKMRFVHDVIATSRAEPAVSATT